MITVNNKNVITDLAKNDFRTSLKKNILIIIAILLTTFLITTVCSMGISYWNAVTKRNIMMEGMQYDVQLPEPTKMQVKKARQLPEIKDAGLSVKCAIADKYKGRPVHIRWYYSDRVNWEKQCIPAFEFVKGAYPSKKNQVMLSTKTLKELGVTRPVIGMKLPFRYYDLSEGGKTHNLTMTLSGYYRDYSGRSRGFVSTGFYQSTGAKQTDLTQGVLNITLKQSIYSNKDIRTLGQQLGIQSPQMIFADSNMMSNFIAFTLGLAVLFVLVFISGYLFIFNILYISIAKKVQFYGQLKTIGTTSKQIRHFIRLQVMWNAMIGIPLGMILGGAVSFAAVPAILTFSNPTLEGTQAVVFHPAIFIGAAAFSLLAVFVSSRKPSVIAGELSPIDASKFIAAETKSKRDSRGGCSLLQMALRNIFREKKQALVVFLSLFVALTAFLAVNVVVEGNQAENVLNAVFDYDLRVLNQTTLNKKPMQEINKQHLKELGQMNEILQIRVLTSTEAVIPFNEATLGPYHKRWYQLPIATGNYEDDMASYKANPEDPMFTGRLVGIDEAELETLAPGINKADFLAGNTAILNPGFNLSAKEAIGKNLEFSTGASTSQTVKIAAQCKRGANYFAGGRSPDILISQQFMDKIVKKPIIELVNIDYKQPFDADTDQRIRGIFSGTKQVSFDSKMDHYKEMEKSADRIKVFGRGLGLILALLAVLNYCNMIAAGIQNRTKEFAALQSIGMTGKQLVKMLVLEGACYGILSILTAAVLGIPISYSVFQAMDRYQVPFSIPVLDNIVVFIGILLICTAMPPVFLKKAQKGSIVEQLREF